MFGKYCQAAAIFLMLLVLNGCKSTAQQQQNPRIQADEKFETLIDTLRDSPQEVSSITLWNTYLDSSQIIDTAAKHNQYLAIAEQLENQEIGCKDIDWFAISYQNFWDLKPHMSALACYQETNNEIEANFHQNAIELIIDTILASGNGEYQYSAYEVATWGDAQDIIELFEYEQVDNYFEFNRQRTTLYNIYVVNDPSTGEQKSVYFENSRFLHQILQLQFPFAGTNDALFENFGEVMGETSPAVVYAKAKVLMKEEYYAQAHELLLMASSLGSVVASHEIGLLCLQPKARLVVADNCSEFLIDSAEQGLTRSLVVLAYMVKEGIELTQDQALFEQLMEAANLNLAPGENWFLLAQLYKKLADDQEQYASFIEKSADLGYQNARFMFYKPSSDDLVDKSPQSVTALLAPLLELAQQGHPLSQAAYASLLLLSDRENEETKKTAKYWLEQAAKNHLPYAHYQLGRAYQSGVFGEKNMLKAYLAYNAAAIDNYAPAQLEVGYFNDIGQVVEANDEVALKWYLLCGKAFNPICLNNLGLFYRRGIATEIDYEKAHVFYDAAIKLGFSGSISQVGLMHETGQGVEQSDTEALALYQQSCEKNHPEGCLYWGNLLAKEQTDFQDFSKANTLYQKSCDLDYAAGCNNLGSSFETGRGIEKDFEQARALYKQACDLGFARSCYNLAFLYEYGNGVQQSTDTAIYYFRTACNLGMFVGCNEFRRLD